MILRNIHLHHFRNFQSKSIDINPQLTVIIGPNARGKTNILEGIYFLVNGTGFRESREIELVQFGEVSMSYVEGALEENSSRTSYKIVLSVHNSSILKSFFINKSKKRYKQYEQEQTKAVLFAPEQIEILTGSPDRRRSYFNKLISFYDLEYKKRLDNYESAVRKRNKILEKYESIEQLKKEIVFWNDFIIEQAVYITEKRQAYIEFLNKHQSIDEKKFRIEFVKNEFTQDRVEHYFELETKTRRTMFGPQKDEFIVYLDNKNVQHFGSRSEQRLAVLWLKLNEIHYYEEVMKRKPIILLDDIFSEFDAQNRKLVLSLIEDYQTIATTTEKEILTLTDIPRNIISL